MIPHIIHYCWFGGNPLPESARRCIASWNKYLPGYEIKQWDESNYDVHKIPYTHEAYEAKKFAFVSDYARFDILYQYGGIYFDTDVEVLKPLDDIISKGPFMGREAGSRMSAYGHPNGLAVAPGLALGVEARHPLYKEFLNFYSKLQFRLEDGSINTKTICWYVTEILLRHGLSDNNNTIENVAGIFIYPPEVFCPMDHTKGNYVRITENTRTIHLYDATWRNHKGLHYKLVRIKKFLIRSYYNIFGSKQ